MDLMQIVSATLGIAQPWRVSKVALDERRQCLEIFIAYGCTGKGDCPYRNDDGTSCAASAESWFHHDFLRRATYLHTRVPHQGCPGLTKSLDRPWARTGSKFVRLASEG